ncbi:hypothetical protein QZH41_007780 [Actinostola sp. cb2023]|nr:hypothetical protein QZH41_007780 [Actinostola sp. cb2023]
MDTENVEPLTPNHLLTMKTKILLPPPGVFMKADLYCRKRWRRVQHLTNEFWKKWRKEYLQTLQMRKKWTAPTRNVKVDDVVIIKDDNLPRNDWKLARVHEKLVVLQYAEIPKDVELRKTYKVILRNETLKLDSQGTRVCSAHFEGGEKICRNHLPTIFPWIKEKKERRELKRQLPQESIQRVKKTKISKC